VGAVFQITCTVLVETLNPAQSISRKPSIIEVFFVFVS